jgi:hypothetical protein
MHGSDPVGPHEKKHNQKFPCDVSDVDRVDPGEKQHIQKVSHDMREAESEPSVILV